MIYLQVTLPTWREIVFNYGPYLGLVLVLIIAILILQRRWFIRVLKAKDEEIKRLVEREKDLNDRIIHMIDKEIGYKKNK
jgi:hypothetical protein